MKHTLLFYLAPEDFAARNDPRRKEAFWGAFMPYMKALMESGVFVSGGGLHDPDSATSLKPRDGKLMVQDGPYADTKEQLGGFVIIDVPDLDAALAWARRYPAGAGGVEIRPNLTQME